MKNIKIPSGFRSPLRPMIYSVASALLFISLEAHAQFSATPPYLQNESSTKGQLTIKHNIMLLIDDSGSMEYVPSSDRRPYSSYYYGYGTREISRLDITKNVLNKVLDKYQDRFNWSLQTLHNNGRTDTQDFSSPWRTIKNKVNGIRAENGTPTTRRYYEVVSNIVMPNIKYRCQKSYVVLMSDGDANLSCNIYDYRGRPIYRISPFEYNNRYYYSDYYGRSIWSAGTDAYNYFGYRRGGYCEDQTGGAYDTVWDRDNGLAFFSRTLATKDIKVGGKDKAGKSWDGDYSDPRGTNFKNQLVQTYTVGFGSGISATGEAYLRNGASGSNNYFNARDENGLFAAFDAITDSIANDSKNEIIEAEGTVSPAVTSSGISGMAANVQLDSGSWSSQLQFFRIDKQTGEVHTSGADIRYPLFTERKTLINTDGKNVYWANETGKYGSDAYFGLTKKKDEWKNALMPWVTRSGQDNTIKDTYSEATGYSQNYRLRETSPSDKRNLGDIIDSSVLTVGGGQTTDGLVDGRNEFLVTAANDGMVHLFQSKNDTHPYSLKLSYIPGGMERDASYGGKNIAETLKEVAHEKYGRDASHPHRYLINGGIVVRRTAEDAEAGIIGQQSFLFGTMGQGARGAYALNIGGKDRTTGKAVGLNAPENTWDKQIPLFETEKGENNQLGYIIGSPQIGRIALEREADGAVKSAEREITVNNKKEKKVRYKNTRYAGFLSNGFALTKGGVKNESALYVYDMLGQDADSGAYGGNKAGTLIQKIVADNSSAQGLSAPTLVDADFDGIVDVAYAGDYKGNMYRFDLRSTDKSKWSVKKIFSGSAAQPITSAPAISRYGLNKYVVIFGTGSDIYQEDVDDKNRQAIYGIYDDLNLQGDKVVAAESKDLLEQELSEMTVDGKTVRQITTNNQVGSNHKGWVVKLGTDDGERVIVKPTMILRTAIVSTRIYNQKKEKISSSGDPCSIDSYKTETMSSSWILTLNALTGGKLDKFDAHLTILRAEGEATDTYYAGLQKEGITSFTYMDSAKLNDSPVTADGDSGGAGTDQAYKTANNEIPNNTCFGKDTLRVLLTNKNESFNVRGRICGVRRLSWGEIF